MHFLRPVSKNVLLDFKYLMPQSCFYSSQPLLLVTEQNGVRDIIMNDQKTRYLAVDKEGRPKLDEIFSTCSDLMLSILRHPVPILAIISGVAAAAGCQLVATCDLAIATTASKFSTPGARHGIFCSTPAVALTRKVPLGVVRSMTITGIPISAQDAYNAGLITRVVSSNEELESETKVLTSAILENSRSVLTLGKQFLYQQMSLNIEEAYR
ncbi:enoyl-CoA hydratase domain-containing protein 3, mitochondrial-like [Diaphorina citri]|uniref:Enoyl-CoA hydratase domain-containing protein 3, mitochondrial n=1 Tax=Diaphorina citri TaxID=121845 RepID=A0A3Q0J041_DIACI|nr:enoyl-CoA hydratase domain-containing protein 3, mitochondrial-like [Diaphorina citri]